MRIHVLRHAEAVVIGGRIKNDRERTLTGKGRRQAALVRALLQELDVAPDVVLSSPYPRALETARLAAPPDTPVTVCEALAPPGDADGVLRRLAECCAHEVLLVGHEPLLGVLVTQLVCGIRAAEQPLNLSKASLACVALDRYPPEWGAGELKWLLNRKIAKTFCGPLPGGAC